MISVKTNNDIEKYQEEVVGGLNAKQMLFAIVAVLVGAGLVLFFHLAIGINLVVSVYLAAPPIMVVTLTGFGKKNGMSYWKRLKREREFKKKGPLLYQSTENLQNYEDILHRAEKEEKAGKEQEDNFDKTVKKFKIIGLITGAVLLGGLVTTVIIKMCL